MSDRTVAIITGASQGIEAAIAKKLTADNAAVVINDAGNESKANETVSEIQTANRTAVAVQAEVASTTDVKRLFDQTKDRLGEIDVLIKPFA